MSLEPLTDAEIQMYYQGNLPDEESVFAVPLRDDIPEVDDEGQDNPIDEGMQEDIQLDDDAPF